MATLFLGRRRGMSGFERYLAIKVVHPHMAEDEKFARMFIDEALISSRIQHPNVVHVEELGSFEDTQYLVMEFVDGCTLSDLLDQLWSERRRMAPELAAFIAMEVAAGLHAAHTTRSPEGELLGIVHRDVSPQNILLAYHGHVKLIDFGIAKANIQKARTRTGALKGKLGYMSPEQAWAEGVDAKSDIYTLGIVLWEMLTGRKLFYGQESDVLDQVRNPTIVPPNDVVSSVTDELGAAVMRALAPEPDDRYATALDFRRAIGRAIPLAFEVDSESLSILLRKTMRDKIAASREVLLSVAPDFEVPDVDPAEDRPLTRELSGDEVERLSGHGSAQQRIGRESTGTFDHQRFRVEKPSGEEGAFKPMREGTLELDPPTSPRPTKPQLGGSDQGDGLRVDPPSFPTDLAMTEEGATWEDESGIPPLQNPSLGLADPHERAHAASAGELEGETEISDREEFERHMMCQEQERILRSDTPTEQLTHEPGAKASRLVPLVVALATILCLGMLLYLILEG